jgi:hypothetical protein
VISSRVLAIVAILLVAAPVRAGGHLWLSVGLSVAQPPAVYKYDLATGQLTRFELPGLGCLSSNLAVDGTHLYLGGACDQTFWKGDIETLFPVQALTYSPPLSDTNLLGDGAWRASNGHLYRTNWCFSPCLNLYETDTDGHLVTSFSVSNVEGLIGLEFVGDRLYATSGDVVENVKFGELTGEPDWTFTEIPLSGPPLGDWLGGLAYDAEDGILYMATMPEWGYENFLWSVDPDAGTATLVRNLGVALGEGLEIPWLDWGIIAMGASSAVLSPVSVETGVDASTWGRIKAKFREE